MPPSLNLNSTSLRLPDLRLEWLTTLRFHRSGGKHRTSYIMSSFGIDSAMSDRTHANDRRVIVPAEGVTTAERYLAKLCKRSFLAMWSYPGVFRDQGQHAHKGDGKEVCDLLVAFENHILIFSDKDCELIGGEHIQENWARWFRKAVQNSAKQVWGAERWIKSFPNRLFLDRQCKIPFPLNLPDPSNAMFHRIVVAHGASRVSREHLGGSGSMMLNSRLIGSAHLNEPLTIGQLDPKKGYIHILDDTTLTILLETLDTITDFTAYLTKKERFLTGRMGVIAAGEEELLAVYLRRLNETGEHDFMIDGKYDDVVFEEGFWNEFVVSPERRAQIEADKISYFWDTLIEKFSFHAMTGTQYLTTGEPIGEQEIMFRFLAREPRTRRRMLSQHFSDALQKSASSARNSYVRVLEPSSAANPFYVFLFLKRRPDLSQENNRNVRGNLLINYCKAVKVKYPQAIHIIGIGTEAAFPSSTRSEDLIYLDVSRWTAENEAEARAIQKQFRLLLNITAHKGREREYPLPGTPTPRKTSLSRNSPCPCNSGKRYKRCCGKDVLR
jgi:hypothetical protein